MGFFRDVSPTRAVKDFANVWQSDTPHRWRILALSVALSAGFFILLIPKSERGDPPRPEITYITTFAPGRSDAEIAASNIENQKRQDKLDAEAEARAERIKAMYRALGRATGLDVDEMERELAQQEAREAAEKDITSPAAAPGQSVDESTQ